MLFVRFSLFLYLFYAEALETFDLYGNSVCYGGYLAKEWWQMAFI